MAVNDYDKAIQGKLVEWDAIRDVLCGERAVKAKEDTYLCRLPGQRPVQGPDGQAVDLYKKYLELAVLLPFAGPFLSRVIGIVFRKPPVFTMPNKELQADCKNITLEAPAVTEEAFAKSVFRENSTTGHGCIVVDYSDVAGRAYQRLYRAGSIGRVWWGMNGAVAEPVRVTLKEYLTDPDVTKADDPFAVEEIEQWRVIELRPDTPLTPQQRDAAGVAGGDDRYPFGYLQHQLYRQELSKDGKRTGAFAKYGEVVVPTRRETPLWFIPVVPFSPFAMSWSIEKPPVLDLVELVLADYRLSADYYGLLHKCGAGTILFGAGIASTEQGKLSSVGAGIAMLCEQPTATLNYVQTNGAAGVEIRTARVDLRADMGTALGRLMAAQQKNVAESGTALELQFSGDDATLQQITGTTALALEQALKIQAWWNGTEKEPCEVNATVELNDAFIKKGFTPKDLIELATFTDMKGWTERDLYFNLKKADQLDPETTFEQWLANRQAGGASMADLSNVIAELEAAIAAQDQDGIDVAMQSLRAATAHNPDQMREVA